MKEYVTVVIEYESSKGTVINADAFLKPAGEMAGINSARVSGVMFFDEVLNLRSSRYRLELIEEAIEALGVGDILETYIDDKLDNY